MSRQGRYWILFVIVAAGLALSWGQVGRKTQRLMEEQPTIFLATEPACRVSVNPCAALAVDRAVVVGPAADGLLIRQTGLTPAQIVRVEAVFVAGDARETDARVLTRGAGAWRASGVPAGSTVLRLSIVGKHETTVAEFSLKM